MTPRICLPLWLVPVFVALGVVLGMAIFGIIGVHG